METCLFMAEVTVVVLKEIFDVALNKVESTRVFLLKTSGNTQEENFCTVKATSAEAFKTDGSFVVHDVPSGSYVVEVISPAHKFEPVRVDITSKGKMRARYVNYIKPSEVVRLPYPLQMKSSGPPSYFIKRESWGWTDFLMNPMVMMMVLPLLIFVLLPKVVNTSDPDMRREMEQSMNMLNSNHELPDVSEFMTRLFSSKSSSKSGGSSSKAGKSSSGKRR
ncbi:PREDICTED: ER membrane protein complex subunit 7 [Corvus brachyrhynchos]|uniref:ER membrane protein complex subunit 7 n=1 Tax=Corvus brachyrhynchos TaxID=85066 RepID=UPI000816684E|nr:PREDICTED: ER membrane protein complex subunit 7 [Corvus brachyrhynchos]